MMKFSSFFKSYGQIIIIYVLIFIVVVPSLMYWYKSTVVEKQDQKIEQLEENITFGQLDHNVEIENTITITQVKERNETLQEILGNIHEKNTTTPDTNYTNAIFDRMWFKSQVP